jgi:signal transduction histidine kinase
MGDQRDGSASERLKRLQLLAEDLSKAIGVHEVAGVLVTAVISSLGTGSGGLWIVDGEVARLLAGNAVLAGTIALETSSPVAEVIRTGTPRELPQLVVLPFAAGGALAIAFDTPRTLERDEVDLVRAIAAHSAIAYDRELQVIEAARHQRRAAAIAQRFEKLREAMEALAGARTAKDVAKVIVETGREATAAIAATVWFLDPVDGFLKIAASHNVADDYLAPYRVIRPESRLPIVRVTNTGMPMFVDTEQELARQAPEAYPHLHSLGPMQPFAILPLSTEDRVLGAIAFTFGGVTHEFADDEREFLIGLSRTCEQALERTRLLEVDAEARHFAESANQRKDEFLAMLGHELRNPLAAMTAALDLLKMRDGTLNRELSVIDRHLASLVHMVSDLLDVSRVTLGKVQLSRSSCDVKLALDHALEAVRPELSKRGHALVVEVPPKLLVNADPERLTQVLSNLVANAVQYTPNGGRIEVIAREEIDDVVIVVRDDGVGIPEELRASIFDAFVQGPRSLDRRQGGLGIGLTLVKQLVDLHGGHVTVESGGEGTGSTFTVTWPKASGTPTTTRMQALTRPKAMRVLVIDHEVDAALAFGRVIEGMGHEVVVVHDAADARAAAERFPADVVFVDLAVGGYALVEQLRSHPQLHAARMVALGPHGSRDEANETKIGVTRHLAKPLDLVQVVTLLS